MSDDDGALTTWSDDVLPGEGVEPWWPAVEPTPRWIRVRLGGELIADSRRALLLLEYRGSGLLPTYFLPRDDVAGGVLVDERADDGTTRWTVQTGTHRVADAAWTYAEPEGVLAPLADHVTFSWDALDWYEEDEPLFAHARDPHKRVDVVRSSRHVQIEVAGEVVADSVRPLLLFETLLPTRYYLPAEDVRTELFEPSATISMCPYKGVARYWSVRVGDTVATDVVWSYPDPVPENPRIRDLLCFFDEKVDVIVDGHRQDRPRTPWS